ncbi:GHMP family kinase ATP-binding protein [Rhodopila globiformis]|uniref:Dehydrogenase n=1 Tax=Rhodopila globiformis TaxID=1071 RepID=A0A2S6N603_RHOGL|nr:dehydrogenase [Rhodopila globiformis]PPQ30053.1 dehydrogenase [Rhodopila globiformis]
MRHNTATVRSRVPLRLGLAGGGTDLSPYCDEHGGAVLNTTIDRYAYAFIEPSTDGLAHFVAPDLEFEECLHPNLDSLAEARLRLHAGVARRMLAQFGGGVLPAIRVTSYVDAPPGSGLGSSSALVVALVEAFTAWLSAPLGPYDVARLAFEVERIDLGLAGGKQDQYAATFGGTNFIEFHAADRVIVNPLRVAPAVLNELQTSLVVCFTGVSRRSEAIIAEQQRGMTATAEHRADAGVVDSLHQLKHDAIAMKEALLRGEIARMAAILNRSWAAKQRTAAGISTGRIAEMYDLAFAHGAIGGKVSGAGGGGFMMFFVPPARRIPVVRALNAAGGTASGVQLTGRGAESWVV